LQVDLAAGYGKLGRVLSAMGRRADALEMFRRGRRMIAAIAEQSPDDPQWEKYFAAFDQDIALLGR